jgi:hypothetical protein
MSPVPDAPDPTLHAIPLFVGALLLEWRVLRRMRARGADVVGYEDARDTWASLAMGLGSIAFVTAINATVFVLAGKLYPHRVVDVGHGVGGRGRARISEQADRLT